jgi:3',5'-nucleoside bisphosphate phosphatase
MHTKLFSSLTLLLCLGTQQSLPAHEDHGVTSLEEFRRPKQRVDLLIPDIEGFKTLKCDFHMHTVFSDGLVWPHIRVQEAWHEGLDAISITDHIEYQPFAKDIPTHHNRAHELAQEPAAKANILLIKGSEITRGTPPGHFNAMFIQDASLLVADNRAEADQAAIDAAAAQKAFIFWNHPGWKTSQIPGSYDWIPFVDELHKADKLHGIEVINGFGFHRKALDWCIDRKLAVMGSSDVHNLTAHDYDFENHRTRTMTLLFAKDRTPEGVREALESARTVAWSSEILAGPEDLLTALFKASIHVGPVHHTDDKGVSHLEVSNRSDFTFILEKAQGKGGLPDKLRLNPRATRMLAATDILKLLADTSYRVTNLYIRSDSNLTITL